MTWAPVFLTLASYAAFLLFRHNAPLLHRLALSSMAVLDGMLSDVPEDDKLAALESATSSLVKTLLTFLGLVVAGGTCIATPCMFVDGLGLGLLATWQGIAAVSVGGTLAFVVPKAAPPSAVRGCEVGPFSAVPVAAQDGPGPPPCPRRADAPRNPSVESPGRNPQPEVFVGHRVGAGRHHEHAGTARGQRGVSQFELRQHAAGPGPRNLAPRAQPHLQPQKERSHGDGIMVGNDSAEALEECFSKPWLPSLTSKKTRSSRTASMPRAMKLTWTTKASPWPPPPPRCDVRGQKQQRPASLPFLREHNRDFHAVVMFREPLTHAASLRAMHRKYCAMQQDDPFVKTYMDWLAHHEFGLGQKPFKFTEDTPLPQGDRDTLDHWLDLWINHYEAALAMDRHRLHFIGYERYCEQPTEVLAALTQEVGAEVEWDACQPHTKKRKVEGDVDPAKLEKARKLYNEMQALQRG